MTEDASRRTGRTNRMLRRALDCGETTGGPVVILGPLHVVCCNLMDSLCLIAAARGDRVAAKRSDVIILTQRLRDVEYRFRTPERSCRGSRFHLFVDHSVDVTKRLIDWWQAAEPTP